MKVKEFIDWIRPITALNPDTDLKIIFIGDEFVVSHLVIKDKEVTICLTESNLDK